MDLIHFKYWFDCLKDSNFLFIAGPCSAESEEQVLQTAKALNNIPLVKVFRAGVWKPRTSPNSFEGRGQEALEWLKLVKEQTDLLTATEVANAKHVEQVLRSEAIDIVWIGARTTGNPFSVQEIAQALRGTDIPVLIKNPVFPDLRLWLGAFERFYKVGLRKLAAIHRGFYPMVKQKLRNIPKWEVPIELKTEYPQIPIIGDPSHIAGLTDYVGEIAQKYLDFNFDGLMIEVHTQPSKAMSDARQQLTPDQFTQLLDKLKFRKPDFDEDFVDKLAKYRMQIDSIDYQIIELLGQRMDIVKKIGAYKNAHDISIFQLDRWKEIVISRIKMGLSLGLDKDFIRNFIQLIHKESINQQIKIRKNGTKRKKTN